MSTATTTVMTIDEFDRKHGDDTFVELVNGQVEHQPMPHRLHGYVSNNVAFELTTFARTARTGRVMTNDSYVLIRKDPPTLRGADVMYLSYDRLPPGAVPPKHLEPSPELVFEIRSPTNTWASFVKKAMEYLDAGVKVVVIIDIDGATATAFRVNEIPQVFDNGDEFTLPDVLPGFGVPLKRFFEEPAA